MWLNTINYSPFLALTVLVISRIRLKTNNTNNSFVLRVYHIEPEASLPYGHLDNNNNNNNSNIIKATSNYIILKITNNGICNDGADSATADVAAAAVANDDEDEDN